MLLIFAYTNQSLVISKKRTLILLYFLWWELSISVLAHLYMKLSIFPSIAVSPLYLCSVECNHFMSILK